MLTDLTSATREEARPYSHQEHWDRDRQWNEQHRKWANHRDVPRVNRYKPELKHDDYAALVKSVRITRWRQDLFYNDIYGFLIDWCMSLKVTVSIITESNKKDSAHGATIFVQCLTRTDARTLIQSTHAQPSLWKWASANTLRLQAEPTSNGSDYEGYMADLAICRGM